MLKLILIFRSLSWSQAFIVKTTYFLSVQTTTIFIFFIGKQARTNTFFKKGVMYELRGLF